jgi:ribonuclease HI
MQTALPHFLLYTESVRCPQGIPRWKFVLQALGGDERLAAADSEVDSRASRLELLAVVRGLEALDRPARVTLLTRSRYVSRGIRRQLNFWRDHHWQWERFGKLVLIRDHDLWQRIDRALEFHRVECCAWHVTNEWGATARAVDSVRGQSWTRSYDTSPRSIVAAAFTRFRHGVFTHLAAIWRPTFTPAA